MYKHFFKRVIDFTISLIALLVIWPILLVVYIWLTIANKGAGAFFFQERPGKNAKIFNMIVLGGLLKVCPVVSTNGVEKGLYKTLPERHHSLIPLNMEAFAEGGKIID